MADVAGVTGHIDRLSAPLTAEIGRLWASIVDEQQEIAASWPHDATLVRKRKLAHLRRSVETMAADVEAAVAAGLPIALAEAWRLGATEAASSLGASAEHAAVDTETLAAIAEDTYADILDRTRYLRSSVKALVRDLAREAVVHKVGTGLPATAAGRRLADMAAGKGVEAIVYSDGSRHGLPDYADMLIRTKTAEAYQEAGITQARRLGVLYMEILDSPQCGLVGHDDTQKADGLILTPERAMRYRISHPRCVRVTTPRPDLTTPADAREAMRAQRAPIQPVGTNRPGAPVGPASSLTVRTATDASGRLAPGSGANRTPTGTLGRPARPGRPQRPTRPQPPGRPG